MKHILRIKPPALTPPGRASYLLIALGIGVAALSLYPVRNMLSPGQEMNASFEPLHLVNTYGALAASPGRVTSDRRRTDEAGVTDDTRWREYEFIGKPGDVNHTPPQIAPYHLRLDWLMWFAASPRRRNILGSSACSGSFWRMTGRAWDFFATIPFPKAAEICSRPALRISLHHSRGTARTGAIWRRNSRGLFSRGVT